MFSISLPIYLPWKLVGVDIGTTFWRATLQLLMLSLKNVRTLPPFGICRKYQPDGAERRRYKGVLTELLVTASLVDQLQKWPRCPTLSCILSQSHFAALSSKRWNWFLNPLNPDWPLTRLANGIWWKWPCASSKCWPQEPLHPPTCSLGHLLPTWGQV